MPFGKLTWTGLMVVAFGWAVLLSAPTLAMAIAQVSGRAPLDMAGIGQNLILSGFGLALLGALQSGFGTLDQFFKSILERTAKQTEAPKPTPARQQQPVKERAKPLPKVVERGWLKDRAYVLFIDGSVEIDTLLGRRRFSSMQDAHEFVG